MEHAVDKPVPARKWRMSFLLWVALVWISACVLIAARWSHGIRSGEEFIAPRLEKCSDYFESRQNWYLDHRRIRERFDRGKTLYDIMTGYGVSAHDIMRIGAAARPSFDLTKVRAGQIIDMWFYKSSEEVAKISFPLPSGKILHITRIGHDFLPSLVAAPQIVVPTVICGEVSSSFYQSAVERDMPPGIILEIADIFAWDIDFLVDIRRGDTFQVVLNLHYSKGRRMGHGRVLAVRFVNQDTVHESFYFTDSQGRSGYYDRRGKSLRKAFLKSPLRYSRISSYFSPRRFHPVLRIYRPHHGVDYAAPVGTPVEAIGDGRIVFMGWNGGYGRYIRIRHNGIYQSCYGHLSRFAKGLKKGIRVRQGDVIGYVGSSGLSTGPHLDFSLIKKGRYVDPMMVESPPAVILSKEDHKRLNEFISKMEQLWQEDQTS